MFLSSIILFFVLALCLGYSITFFVKKPDNLLERMLMNMGFGLGVFAVLACLLDLVKIQLHWMVFLGISILVPLFFAYMHISKHGLKLRFSKRQTLTKSTIYILMVLVICAVFFAVYHKGAFIYPYLEDDDPWFHAESAKYIAMHRTFSHDPNISMHYIEPYPPAYAVLMGVLHQTNNSIIWNLKFFNVLIISLGIVFFYFFAKELFGSRRKALFSTFVIAIIPCFMSHFIWASSLAIVLFFPAFYAVEMIKHDRNWWIVAAIMAAGVLLSQPSNGVIFGLMFGIYWIVKAVTTKSFQKYIFIAGLVGFLLAFAVFYLPIIVKYGWAGMGEGIGFGSTSLLHFSSAESGGGLLYAWNDFIFAQNQSKMDNPIGVGVVLFFLLVFSLIFALYSILRKPESIRSEESFASILIIAWLIFAFAGIHGNRLPVQLMPHRFWAIFAIPVALLCVEGLFALVNISERLKVPKIFIYAAIILGLLVTSAYPKYVVETSYWPPGVNWGSMDEVQGYLNYVKPLPQDTKVFPLCSPEFKVLAFDKYAEPWDPAYASFKKTAFDTSAENMHSWLRLRGYGYLTIDSYCARDHDINATNEKLLEIGNSTRFSYVNGNKGFFLFKVI